MDDNTAETPVVIVLDDMDERHKWIRGVLAGTGAAVCPCYTVTEFRDALECWPAPALIILDHDLGENSTTGPDANGETGLHAARAIPAHHTSPVIVWSLNSYRADQMKYELRSRGVNAQTCAFVESNKWVLSKAVLESIGGAR